MTSHRMYIDHTHILTTAFPGRMPPRPANYTILALTVLNPCYFVTMAFQALLWAIRVVTLCYLALLSTFPLMHVLHCRPSSLIVNYSLLEGRSVACKSWVNVLQL